MSISRFTLTFSHDSCPAIFPIPIGNQYQNVTELKIPRSGEILSISPINQILIMSEKTSTISFIHEPICVDKKIATSRIAFSDKTTDFQSDVFINHQDQSMRDLADQWLQGIDTANANSVLEVLYQKTLNYLQYGNPIPGLHPYSQALQDRVTDCGGFSTFLATLLQTQKIPCRLVVGYLYKLGWKYQIKELLQFPKSFSDITMHAWLEVQQADGGWFPVDPSVEWKRVHGLSQRQGGFGDIPADRLVLSFGHNLKLTWKKKEYIFPILQHPEVIV
jgi:hypothetical protein